MKTFTLVFLLMVVSVGFGFCDSNDDVWKPASYSACPKWAMPGWNSALGETLQGYPNIIDAKPKQFASRMEAFHMARAESNVVRQALRIAQVNQLLQAIVLIVLLVVIIYLLVQVAGLRRLVFNQVPAQPAQPIIFYPPANPIFPVEGWREVQQGQMENLQTMGRILDLLENRARPEHVQEDPIVEPALQGPEGFIAIPRDVIEDAVRRSGYLLTNRRDHEEGRRAPEAPAPPTEP